MAQLSVVCTTAGIVAADLVGADGIAVTTTTGMITISGFRTEFVSASGFLQGQIDAGGGGGGGVVPNALVGSDGITVSSGSSTDIISGFYSEFTAASGTLQTDIDTKVTASNPILTGPLRLINGVSATPAMTFTNDTTSGIYRDAAGYTVNVGVGSKHALKAYRSGANARVEIIEYLDVDKDVDVTGDLNVDGSITAGDGAYTDFLTVSGVPVDLATNPSAHLVTTSGNLQEQIDSKLSLSGGTMTGALIMNNPILLPDGVPTTPALAFASESFTGLYLDVPYSIAFSLGGNKAFRAFFQAGPGVKTQTYGPSLGYDGSTAAPSYSFSSDPDTGMYRVGADIIGFTAGNSKELTISGTGVGIADNLTADQGAFASSLTVSGLPVITSSPSLIASTTLDVPSDDEDFTIMKTISDVTLSSLHAVIRGPGSPSVTWTIRHAAKRSDTGTEVVTAGTETTDTGAGDVITVLDNPTITGNSWVWLETTVTGGSPQELTVELYA